MIKCSDLGIVLCDYSVSSNSSRIVRERMIEHIKDSHSGFVESFTKHDLKLMDFKMRRQLA